MCAPRGRLVPQLLLDRLDPLEMQVEEPTEELDHEQEVLLPVGQERRVRPTRRPTLILRSRAS